MKRLLALPLFILTLCAHSSAQETPTKCPEILLTGPPGIVNIGELAAYTATVGPEAEQYPIEYFWTVSAGRIKDGQGTTSIRVVQPSASLTVRFEIRGLPAGCPSAASEVCCGDPPPVAEKFYELRADKSVEKLDVTLVRRSLSANPTDQLYILAGDGGVRNAASFRKKLAAILRILIRSGVTQDRITITPVNADVELFQFWLVPPGAENPRCEECEQAAKETAAPNPRPPN